jgi:hypothetical protein
MKFDEHNIRQFETLARDLLVKFPEAKPSRTRDCIQIDYLGEEGVVILLTPEAVDVRLPTIDWTQGAYGPAASSRLQKRHELADSSGIMKSIHEALSKRQAQFNECPYCHKTFPPERMAAGACHSCAERHLNVVF